MFLGSDFLALSYGTGRFSSLHLLLSCLVSFDTVVVPPLLMIEVFGPSPTLPTLVYPFVHADIHYYFYTKHFLSKYSRGPRERGRRAQ